MQLVPEILVTQDLSVCHYQCNDGLTSLKRSDSHTLKSGYNYNFHLCITQIHILSSAHLRSESIQKQHKWTLTSNGSKYT